MRLEALVGGKAEVIGPEATLQEAAEAMLDGDVGSLAVVKKRELVGILTERDIVSAANDGAGFSIFPPFGDNARLDADELAFIEDQLKIGTYKVHVTTIPFFRII